MAKHRKTGNRAGEKTELERERRLSAELEQMLMDQAVEHIKEDANFFATLPPSTQAQFLQGRLPKPKDLDQDLKSSALSLSAAIEQLETIDDISQKACALAIHCRKLEEVIEAQKEMLNEVRRITKKRTSVDPVLILNLLQRVVTATNNYHLERETALLSEEDIKKWVDDAIGRSGLAANE